jgi:hypothetical protein
LALKIWFFLSPGGVAPTAPFDCQDFDDPFPFLAGEVVAFDDEPAFIFKFEEHVPFCPNPDPDRRLLFPENISWSTGFPTWKNDLEAQGSRNWHELFGKRIKLWDLFLRNSLSFAILASMKVVIASCNSMS